MPKLSVLPVIYTKNKDDGQVATISIRVSYNRKSRYRQTDYACQISHFDKKTGLIKKDDPNHQLANAAIGTQRGKIEKDLLYLKDDPGFNITTIERYLTPVQSPLNMSFSQFVLDYIEAQKREKDITKKRTRGTLINYQKHLNKIHDFAKKKNLLFEEINVSFLNRYKNWLFDKGNKHNTVWDSLTKFVQKFFNEAEIPLPKFDWVWPIETAVEYLTLDEVEAIERAYPDLPFFEKMDAAYFLLECYAGIRHSDWKRFELEKLVDGDNFKVRARKNGEPIYLSLKNRPRLKKLLLGLRDLPYTSSLFNTNKNLKIVAAKARIEKPVTTHKARHTCAVLHAEMGFSKEYVAELLGVSMKTVEVYYKITRQKLRREDERLQGL